MIHKRQEADYQQPENKANSGFSCLSKTSVLSSYSDLSPALHASLNSAGPQVLSVRSHAKAFDCVDHKLENSERDGNTRPPDLPLEKSVCRSRTNMEQETGSKFGKEYIKAVYCHLAYLTYMQGTSWETLGWMKHNLESRLLGEISMTSDMQMTPSLCRKQRTEEPLESERGEWKSWLKAQHSEN